VSRGGISRRAFLAGAGGAAVGGGLLAAACGGGSDGGPAAEAGRVPFAGPHQAGITLEPAPATGLVAPSPCWRGTAPSFAASWPT
jgi:hypothetical protein